MLEQENNEMLIIQREKLLQELKKAVINFQNAQHKLDTSDDQELVDYLIYNYLAAERRYVYLLQEYKKLYYNY